MKPETEAHGNLLGTLACFIDSVSVLSQGINVIFTATLSLWVKSNHFSRQVEMAAKPVTAHVPIAQHIAQHEV
jgi:hypothetical protein